MGDKLSKLLFQHKELYVQVFNTTDDQAAAVPETVIAKAPEQDIKETPAIDFKTQASAKYAPVHREMTTLKDGTDVSPEECESDGG